MDRKPFPRHQGSDRSADAQDCLRTWRNEGRERFGWQVPLVSIVFLGCLVVGLQKWWSQWDADQITRQAAPVLTSALVEEEMTPQAFRDEINKRITELGADHEFQRLIKRVSSLPREKSIEQLQAVNRYFNRGIVYAEDIDNWGTKEYWASPMETLVRGKGDCEDYAIAKYFTLLKSGFPGSRMRLVYVKLIENTGSSRAHMILAIDDGESDAPMALGEKTLIMDNLVDSILPASRRPDLVPVYSFTLDKLFVESYQPSRRERRAGLINAAVAAGNATDYGNPMSRMTQWGRVAEKARREGFID